MTIREVRAVMRVARGPGERTDVRERDTTLPGHMTGMGVIKEMGEDR